MLGDHKQRILGAVCGAVVLYGGLAAAWGQSCNPLEEQAKQEAKAPRAMSVADLRVPEKAWQHYGKALAGYRAGQSDTAAREIEAALAIAPAFAQPYVLRGLQDRTAGRFEATIADALTAQRLNPRVGGAGILLGGAYNGLRRYQEAAAVLRQLPGDQAESWQAKYEMTRAAVGLQDVAEALRWSALTVVAAPASCVDAGLLRANAFLLAHRWPEAVAQLTLYVESPYPQSHHAQALQVLERVKRRAWEEEEASTVARAEGGGPTP